MTIYTSLLGGLGNQMFQYAAARALARRLQAELKLDVIAYDNRAMHQGFELQRIFNIQAEIASRNEIRQLLGWQAAPLVRRVLSRPAFSALRHKAWLAEPHFHYWDGLERASDGCYLSGYWQSERYFTHEAAALRMEFAFTEPLSTQNAQWAQQIAMSNAVSLHVRRGDYVGHVVHGTCSLEYYRQAVQAMAQQLVDPHFYIFSDDMAWVRQHLQLPYPCHYVENNRGAESYNDMRLMSMCRHYILANSSFSWWGAWLNPFPEKIVIAPDKWFRHDHDTTDLYLTGWVRL